MHLGEGSKRSMVHDVGICDREDHPPPGAKLAVQLALKVDHQRLAAGLLLGVHAVVGGHPDPGAKFKQTSQLLIHPIQTLRPSDFGTSFHETAA